MLDPTYLLDWANLLLRWVHVITAIAWVGSSFYFVWLDNNLVAPSDELRAQGVGGTLWAVHGGGFYNPRKYLGAPPKIDSHLHWFYWESYSTWLSGFALFTALYLWNAATFLVDKSVHDWSGAAAGGAALALLAAFWFVYDAICRTLGQRSEAAVSVATAALVVASAWLACQLFAGRAAFLIVGAMIATAMSANVFFVIIPGQRRTVAALTGGGTVDPRDGQRAKQRSVHNTYFTLPVLVAMLSNHYAWLVQGPRNWLVLAALMAAGALIRHSFVARHQARLRGERAPWQWAGLGVALLLAPLVLLAPAPRSAAPVAAAPVDYAALRALLDQRCTMCHNAQVAQKNVALHTPELVAQQALSIYQQVVITRQMPFNNATGITDAERALVERWFKGGAPTR